VKGEKLPAFDITQAPHELRARILSERQRIVVNHDPPRVGNNCCARGTTKAPELRLKIKNHQPSTDNVLARSCERAGDIKLITEPWTRETGEIEWFALTPKHWRCNVTDLSTNQVGFVANAAHARLERAGD